MVQIFSDRNISVTDFLSFIGGDGINYPSAWHPIGLSDNGCGVRTEICSQSLSTKSDLFDNKVVSTE
jgi:hypothetical protein